MSSVISLNVNVVDQFLAACLSKRDRRCPVPIILIDGGKHEIEVFGIAETLPMANGQLRFCQVNGCVQAD